MITDIILTALKKDPTIKRHLLKTITWRLIGSVDTTILGWLISGEISIGIKIGGMELLTKMLLYFIHERIWHRIPYGIPTRAAKADQIKKELDHQLFEQYFSVTKKDRELQNNHPAFTIWFSGLSASGKSTIASKLDTYFFSKTKKSYILDGDNTRLGINSDLSFSKDDRKENIRRVAEIAKLLNDAGIIVIASFISPFEADRQKAKAIIGEKFFTEVFIDTDISVCKQRDKKGLYQLAEQGKIKEFTGISSPYEKPTAPDIYINNNSATVDAAIQQIIRYLETRQLLQADTTKLH